MDVHIRERHLPGIGLRYELRLGRGRLLSIVVEAGGRREIGIGSAAADEPEATATLEEAEAVAVAAILTGARFSIDTTEDPRVESDTVTITSVTLADTSPAVGLLASEVPFPPGSEASVLAVIRDQTPELLEDIERRPLRPGDRVVLAARRDRLADVLRGFAR